MAPVYRSSQKGPQQHGDTDRGFLLEPRIGRIVLLLAGSSIEDLYNKRTRLINLFKPSNDHVLLHFPYHEGGRRFKVHYAGEMLFPSGERQGWLQKVAIVLKANDPTCYDPTARAATITLGGGGGGFEVPTPVPFEIGASSINQSQVVENAGSWRAVPSLIRIVGPITDPVITNETTGRALDFTGTTITLGDYFDLDPRYGQVTIVDSNGDSQLAALADESILSGWYLAAAPEPGTEDDPRRNSIRVEGSGITSTTKIEISWLDRYLGL